jgi:sugar lactone lactonase YvrE
LRRGISDPTPLINKSGSFTAPQDTVFDSSGNLWVIDGGTPQTVNGQMVTGTGEGVFEFTNQQLRNLSKNPTPDPAFAITNSNGVPGFVFPQFGVFDKSGNLYIADSGADVIFVFTAKQLTSSSGTGLTPTAAFMIKTSNAVLGEAFDRKGNLFVADNGDAQIFEINKSHIPATGGTVGTPTPVTADAVLSSNDLQPASIDTPWGLVFDKKGNLWFSNEGVANTDPSVVEFLASALYTSSTPTPKVQLTPTTLSNGLASISDPQGISIDLLGDLAIANDTNNTVAEFGPFQLRKSGTPVPKTFLAGSNTTLNAPTGLIFGPNIEPSHSRH